MTCTWFVLALATVHLSLRQNSWREDKQLMWFWRRAWAVPGHCRVCCAPVLVGFNPVLGRALWCRIQTLDGYL